MKPQDVGPRARKFQDPETAIEALVNWDELGAEDLLELQQDPHLAPRLETLRAAEAWLQGSAARARAQAQACPEAEQLYDFGRGPGYAPLAAEQRSRIESHVQTCAECQSFLDSLAAAPPSPLVLAPSPATIGAPRRRDQPSPSPILELRTIRRRRLQRVALASAATVVGTLSLWLVLGERDSGQGLPSMPLLRGGGETALFFPRGPVLGAQDRIPALPLRFELRAVPDASEYRVEILRHSGGAFDAGVKAGELHGGLDALLMSERLAPGSYTWRAHATVHGLERELGARDFEVIQDASLLERLGSAPGADELERTRERVRVLHDAGDWTDARELARTLPPSADRDRYLDQLPGR